MRTPLSTHLSPNVERVDLAFAFGARFLPWRWMSWKKGNASEALESRFTQMFGSEVSVAYDSGRTALQAVIEALELPKDAGVIVQAFSCIVVPNSVQAAQVRPVFVDIDETYNIDPDALKKALQADSSIKAVVVQHTFGVPADMDRIVALCTEFDVQLIEDCAHALGARYRGNLLGTFGVAAIFSFGRDKVISTVSGGMAIAHRKDVAQRLQQSSSKLPLPGWRWIAQRLNHPLIFWLSLKTYYFASLGKVIVALAKKFRLFPLVLESCEKRGEQVAGLRFPNILAAWALIQMDRLANFHAHRQKIALFYEQQLGDLEGVTVQQLHTSFEDAIFFRYTIAVERSEELLKLAKNEGILLGDWYRTVLAPTDSLPATVGYVEGSCPVAERAITRVVNLPTHINVTLEDAQRVVDVIKKHLKK